MRLIVLLALCSTLGLTACNLVVTAEPVFTAADEAGAPALKEGVWFSRERGCRVNLFKKIDQWPDCVSGFIYRDGLYHFEDSDRGIGVILASGDPRILQVQIPAETAEAGSSEPESGFLYLVVEPRKTDDAGRIVEFQSWFVQCGPIPPNDTRRGRGIVNYYTKQPGPGLTMLDDGNCSPKDRAALVTAARASGGYADANKRTNRWLRDKD